MKNTLRFGLLAGTLLSPLTIYMYLLAIKEEITFSNILMGWLISMVAIIILKFFTDLQVIGEKYGEKIGARIFGKQHENTVQPLENKTILQEICGLVFIGEYLVTLIALLPVFIYAIADQNPSKDVSMIEWIFVLTILYLWLIFLERTGRIKVCVPPLNIPMKWLLIPFAIGFEYF